jgi:hypothetical protein
MIIVEYFSRTSATLATNSQSICRHLLQIGNKAENILFSVSPWTAVILQRCHIRRRDLFLL